MLRMTRTFIALTASSALALQTAPVWAQAPGALYTVVVPSSQFGSPNFTQLVVNGLAAARAFCGKLENKAYVVDCLAERLDAVSDQMDLEGNTGDDYAEVRSILSDTSGKLQKLARDNRDRALPRGKASTTSGSTTIRTSRPLTPVSAPAAADVNARATAILDEAETLLLRSAAGSADKTAQYTRIADALRSNKVLIRST